MLLFLLCSVASKSCECENVLSSSINVYTESYMQVGVFVSVYIYKCLLHESKCGVAEIFHQQADLFSGA